ncbi:MAG: GIY-YIG nuclease family protein [Candidatus Kerfeldbacteria bacterium]|nr:GIY-YIG nuclease family protein [Candidatus Kerfeldbacteria bacterium]
MYYVYLLEDQQTRQWYIGFTGHLLQRLRQHQQGEVTTTRTKKSLHLIYVEGYLDKRDALGREKFLKSGSGHRFLKKQLYHHLGPSHPLTPSPYSNRNVCA